MSQIKKWIAFAAGATASVFLALLASSPIGAADPTAPPNPGTLNTEWPAEQPKPADQPKPGPPVSAPETLRTTAQFMKGIPATPALVLQSTSSILTGAVATPAELLLASANVLGVAGIK